MLTHLPIWLLLKGKLIFRHKNFVCFNWYYYSPMQFDTFHVFIVFSVSELIFQPFMYVQWEITHPFTITKAWQKKRKGRNLIIKKFEVTVLSWFSFFGFLRVILLYVSLLPPILFSSFYKFRLRYSLPAALYFKARKKISIKLLIQQCCLFCISKNTLIVKRVHDTLLKNTISYSYKP